MGIKANLLIIWRRLLFNKSFAILNIIGLGIGLSVAVIVFLFVNNELSFDRFNKDVDHIYMSIYNRDDLNPVFPIPFAEALQNEVSDVETAANIFPWSVDKTLTVNGGDFHEKCFFMDEGIFRIFSFPVIRQSGKDLFPDDNSLAVSEKLAVTFFGSVENAIGKPILLDKKKTCTITTVFKDIPANSSVRFEMAAPSGSVIKEYNISREWNDSNVRTFVKLRAGAEQSEKSLAAFSKAHGLDFQLFPLTELHLAQKGDEQKKALIIAILASIFVMLLACINFINLSTADIFKRTKEAGINKLLGSSSLGLCRSFILETLMITLVSLLFAILFSFLLLPYINHLTGLSLSFIQLNITKALLLLGIVSATSLLTALIPALLFSKARPIQIISKQTVLKGSSVFLRKGLIVLQLTLTIIIITSTLFINKQVQFISKTNLGFDKDNMVFIDPDTYDAVVHKAAALKEELLKCPDITSVCAIDCPPGIIGTASSAINWPGKSDDDRAMIYLLRVGDDFVKTFDVKIISGEGFQERTERQGVLINETLAKKIRQKDSSGDLSLSFGGHQLNVLGVTKDFAFNSIKDAQQASIIIYQPSRGFYPCIRFSDKAKAPVVLAHINKCMHNLFPDTAYKISFTNDFIMQEFLAREIRLSKFFSLFSFLGILVCCIGLLGLTIFESQKRTKEIGVRKVTGASNSEILVLLSLDYMQWLAIAFIVATPVVYYSLHKWLQGFAYRTNLSWWVYAVSGLLTITITFLTISIQSFRASTRNPVEALRYE
jgi:putative ABC transport system permease protein